MRAGSVVIGIGFRYGYEMPQQPKPHPPSRRLPALALCTGLLVVLAATAGCGATPNGVGTGDGPGARSHAVLNVVAAENTWGSLATQLGGRQVRVTSIISDPNADPHEYESNAADARAFASANVVILNGAGYDDWANKLLSAEPAAGRKVITAATLVGKTAGDNPHLWYDPSYVYKVIDSITATYESVEPAEKAYFAARHEAVEDGLSGYRGRLAYITKHFAGDKVAATESIFQYMAQYLRLDLVTPYSFMKAVAEGTDPPASSIATFDRQISSKDFRVLVYNIQTVTPLTTTIKEQTAQNDIPVIGVSETIQPPMASFQQWMVGQLDNLANALDANQLGQ